MQFGFIFALLKTQGFPVLIVLMIGLLLLSFCISGALMAFFTLTYKEINLLKTRQHAAAKKIVDLLDKPKMLYGSLIIAGIIVNVAAVLTASYLLSDGFPGLQQSVWLGYLVKLVSITTILLLFAQFLPKMWAGQDNIRFAHNSLVQGVASLCLTLFKGMSEWMMARSQAIENWFNRGNSISKETSDYEVAIDKLPDEEAGIQEKHILKGIRKFRNISVKQIMKSRLDVSGIEYESSFENVKRRVEELHYSRLPVFHKTMDDIKGMIHTKDLLPHLHAHEPFDWHSLIRPPYFVHEQKLIDDLLQEFRQRRIHFAVVVDEFGGTSGIVTLEDIMEEITGDIKDEFDEEENPNKKIDDYTFIFEGKTMIQDLCKAMNLPIDTFDKVKGESDSLAGLILEIAEAFPVEDQIIPCGDFSFTVLSIAKNRIEKVKVSIKPPEAR